MNRFRDWTRRVSSASIRNYVDLTLLQSLCILGQIEGLSTFEQASDHSVGRWLDGRLALAPYDMAERVRYAIDSVTYQTCR